jgi:RNA polymerase sigma-70 factor (ECF subfamily)
MSIATEILSVRSVIRMERAMSLDLETIAPSPQAAAAAPREDDFALLRRYASFGDPHAFAQIVQRYASFVYATCLRVIGDGSRAEDLSQETFFRLMRRPHEVRQNLGGWLHRTATHLALDSLRSETSRRKREITYTLEADHEASTWSELSPAVDQALAEMPEESRILLVSHFLLGKTQAEIAEEMEQSPSTISRRMHQALAQLRQHLRLKGVYALPAALAGLLCHVAARKAPASLVTELGKMAMVSGTGAAARVAQFGSANPKNNPLTPKQFIKHVSPPLGLAFLGMVAMLILLRLATLWLTPRATTEPDHQPHLHANPASAMLVWGSPIQGQYNLTKDPASFPKTP